MSDTFVPPAPSDDYVLFLLRTKDGHEYKLYLNGMGEGFPEGTLVINRAAPLYGFLYSFWKKGLPASKIPASELQVVP